MNRSNYALAQGFLSDGAWRIDGESVVLADGSAVPSLVNTTGYRQLRFGHEGKRVMVLLHRVIWECSNGSIPDGLQVNHVDGDKTNNRLDNLELVTPRDNTKHAYRTLAAEFGVSRFTISDIKTGRKWAADTADLRTPA